MLVLQARAPLGAEGKPVPGPTTASKGGPDATIAHLVEQLGSPKFEEREAASKALDKIGEPALEALRGAARSRDAEVRRRAADLLKAIEAHTKNRTIRVVATWADLLRQPVIDVGDVRVRLGISSTRCPRWSCLFLYAFSEGYNNWQVHKTNRDRLGPLWVSVRFGDRLLDAPDKYDSTTVRVRRGLAPHYPPLLFARTLLIDKPGRYSIAFRTEAGVVEQGVGGRLIVAHDAQQARRNGPRSSAKWRMS
jgi:hypothetical protein